MPIGLPAVPELVEVPGVQLAAASAGLKNDGREDIALFRLAPSTVAAAVFTQNRFCAAPVTVARRHLEAKAPRALIVNSGNANAGTGTRGERDAERLCRAVANEFGLSEQEVLPFSTGVIGAPLPVAEMERAFVACGSRLKADNWLAAARAIMTTDTVPKGLSRCFALEQTDVTLTGIAKGSGMIRPDMATMLAFIACDAVVDKALLDSLLRRAVEKSFNRITIDGDTSTNDACVLLATGCSGAAPLTDEADPRCAVLADNLDRLCLDLAQSLIRDGEGATKFVTVAVSGAADDADARRLAYAIAHSPLVKTALFASDPNWGRILAVIGRAGVAVDIARVSLALNDVSIVERGEPAPGYTEAAGQRSVASPEIRILIDLGLGAGGTEVWTTDLSYDYVKINAEYRS